MAPAFTWVTPVNGECKFNLEASPGKALNVDWGDGNTETFIFGNETLYLEHLYEMIGLKFVTITGDISSISKVSLYYDDAPTSSIHINHLTNLTDFGMGFTSTKAPSEIDFSDNLMLKKLTLGHTYLQSLDISKNLEIES